ncbi:MAG: NUDIX domain-containing protein [Boseongicola sp.]|nr:MAG: NUDIX domain-containing protein [Boseongicola sp.]
MIPVIGESIRRNQSYRRRPGVYAVLVRNNSVLLTHQEVPRPEFQLPGGGVDPGEHVLPALHREVLEETGWVIDRPRRLGVYRRFTFMPEYNIWAEKICQIYMARPTLQLGPPTEDGHTAVWTDYAQALKLLQNDGDRRFLAGHCLKCPFAFQLSVVRVFGTKGGLD